MSEVESTSTFDCEKYDDQLRELKSTEEKIKRLQNSCTKLDLTIKSMSENQEAMESKFLDAEFRNMRKIDFLRHTGSNLYSDGFCRNSIFPERKFINLMIVTSKNVVLNFAKTIYYANLIRN